ncbi:hypothetical protein CGK27_23720 [Vibrio parahaemolyticus]|nr:hypothetical protein CGK27_23720 [Vibrio parahaemolyticus]TOA49022.1 hypothetical protein CGK25_11965 [Vibrio parahaemolyticus]TOA94166.1 hypothetical protein CGK15_23980 [Vibrio parahaemolyticus]TOO24010.1 hypothetical protein CGH41_21685 [Vibrio parahaemolyticus]
MKLSYWRSISVLISVVKIQNWHRFKGKFVLWCCEFGVIESNFFAETLLCEFVGTKADLLAERMLSQVWQVHVVSVTLLKVRIVRLVF